MPCESCTIQFSVFRRKRVCSECERYYCSGCLRRGGGVMCAPCRLLSTRPLSRQALVHLKVRDLQCFLHHQNICTRHCVEKDDLIGLVVQHVNSGAYRRRNSRPNSGTFNSLKYFTNNINELLNSAFNNLPTSPRSNVNNRSGVSRPTSPPSAPGAARCPHPSQHDTIPSAPPLSAFPLAEPRTTSSPGAGTPTSPDARNPTSPGARTLSSPESPNTPEIPSRLREIRREHDRVVNSARRETDDCFEIEDLDDMLWEFVTTPASPLPQDSEVLIENTLNAPSTPVRASSELDLRRSESIHSTDTASLRDETCMSPPPPPIKKPATSRIELSSVNDPTELEDLNIKQLKDLLALNRVDYKGCLERTDLLERAKLLWKENSKYKNQADNLPLEECCKICMSAPLECVLLECGHIAACTACSKQLADCPICRQYVVRAVRFFRS